MSASTQPLCQSSIDRRGLAAGRWIAAGVLIIGLHVCGGAAGYIYWDATPTELLMPPPTVIAFELAPLPVAPPQRIEAPMPEIEPVVEPPPPVSELDLIPPTPAAAKPVVALPEKKKPEQKKQAVKKKPVETPPPPQVLKTAAIAPSTTKTEALLQPVQAEGAVAAGPTPDEIARIGNAKSTWQLALAKHLEKHKKYPKAAERRNHEGAPTVTFVIDRQGNVIDAQISRGSGHESLDEAAVKTFLRASPLPKVPPEIAGETLRFNLALRFKLTD